MKWNEFISFLLFLILVLSVLIYFQPFKEKTLGIRPIFLNNTEDVLMEPNVVQKGDFSYHTGTDFAKGDDTLKYKSVFIARSVSVFEKRVQCSNCGFIRDMIFYEQGTPCYRCGVTHKWTRIISRFDPITFCFIVKTEEGDHSVPLDTTEETK